MDITRFNSNRSRNVTLIVALALMMHFLLSSLVWAVFVWAAIRQRLILRPVLLGSVPAVLLLLRFAMVAFAALCRRRASAWLLVIGLIAGAGVFAYDATTRNWQLHAENFLAEGHQKTFYYNTWWWYDESWCYR